MIIDERSLPVFIHSELDDFGLSPIEFRVYCRIARRAGRGECIESIANMAQGCKVSEASIKRALKLLHDHKLVIREPRPGYTTIYRLTDPHHWISLERPSSLETQLTRNLGGSSPVTQGGSSPVTQGVAHQRPTKLLPLSYSLEGGESDEQKPNRVNLPPPEKKKWIPAPRIQNHLTEFENRCSGLSPYRKDSGNGIDSFDPEYLDFLVNKESLFNVKNRHDAARYLISLEKPFPECKANLELLLDEFKKGSAAAPQKIDEQITKSKIFYGIQISAYEYEYAVKNGWDFNGNKYVRNGEFYSQDSDCFSGSIGIRVA